MTAVPPKTKKNHQRRSPFRIPHGIMLKFQPRRCRRDEIAHLGSVQEGPWSVEEHESLIKAMILYPTDSWCTIATEVKTRTPRQCANHFQKIRSRMEHHNQLVNRPPSPPPPPTNFPRFNIYLNMDELPNKTTNTITETNRSHKMNEYASVNPFSTQEVEIDTPMHSQVICPVVTPGQSDPLISPIHFPLEYRHVDTERFLKQMKLSQETNWKDDDIVQWFCEAFS